MCCRMPHPNNDQTLFFYNLSVGQRLLNVCWEYAAEHHYRYSTSKSKSIIPNSLSGELHLGSTVIPRAVHAPLLGVPLRPTGLDIELLVRSTTTKAESWLNRLTASDLLSTNFISPAKKRVLIATWICSQYEYCLSLLNPSKHSIKLISTLINKSVAVCFKVKRATFPMMRFIGFNPTVNRIQFLQLKFRSRLYSHSRSPLECRTMQCMQDQSDSNFQLPLSGR
jgi:hypothetical protein